MHDQAYDGLTPRQDGNDEAPVEAETALEASLDPFEESVYAELEKIRNPKANWVQTLAILAISLVLFLGLGARSNPVAFTAMLVGVLFFHELGHYVGMRIFGYRNVRMFFIPLFGAAVSGQRTSVKSYQEAIVTLLGPVPGLCLAIVLLGVGLVPGLSREQRLPLIQVALLLGLINAFNLLPVFPLDGGRLLNQILFSRNRYLEVIFLLLAAAALIAYGVLPDRKLFLFLGVWLLVSIGPTFRTNSIAQIVGKQVGDQLPPMDGPIPLPILEAIVDQVRSRLPNVKTAKAVAGMVFRVWERMQVKPPGAVATLVLLLVYLVAALLTIPWLLPLFVRPAPA